MSGAESRGAGGPGSDGDGGTRSRDQRDVTLSLGAAAARIRGVRVAARPHAATHAADGSGTLSHGELPLPLSHVALLVPCRPGEPECPWWGWEEQLVKYILDQAHTPSPLRQPRRVQRRCAAAARHVLWKDTTQARIWRHSHLAAGT